MAEGVHAYPSFPGGQGPEVERVEAGFTGTIWWHGVKAVAHQWDQSAMTWIWGTWIFVNSGPCLHCFYSGLGLRKTGLIPSVHKNHLTTSRLPVRSPSQLVRERRAGHRPGPFSKTTLPKGWRLPSGFRLGAFGCCRGGKADHSSVFWIWCLFIGLLAFLLEGRGFCKSKTNQRLLSSLP